MVVELHSSPRILVVEDSLLLAEAICEIVSAAAMVPVGPIVSVAEAFQALSDLCFDAAVLDTQLLDGEIFPFCKELNQRQVPFLILTGKKFQVLPSEFRGLPFLSKPFSVEALSIALADLMRTTPDIGLAT